MTPIVWTQPVAGLHEANLIFPDGQRARAVVSYQVSLGWWEVSIMFGDVPAAPMCRRVDKSVHGFSKDQLAKTWANTTLRHMGYDSSRGGHGPIRLHVDFGGGNTAVLALSRGEIWNVCNYHPGATANLYVGGRALVAYAFDAADSDWYTWLDSD